MWSSYSSLHVWAWSLLIVSKLRKEEMCGWTIFPSICEKENCEVLTARAINEKNKKNNFNRKNFHFELMESFMKKQRERDQRYSMETYSLEYIYS